MRPPHPDETFSLKAYGTKFHFPYCTKKEGGLSYYASASTFVRTIDQKSTGDDRIITQTRIVRASGPDLETQINTEIQELELRGATIGRAH